MCMAFFCSRYGGIRQGGLQRAKCFGISGAHCTHTAKCQSSDKSDKSDKSDILCSHPVLCAKCPARQQNTQPCAIEIPKHMAHTAPCANRPYKSVQVRTSPYSLAPTLCIAQCALPAGGNVLCFFLDAMHMAHGGKPYFSPRVPPFRPCVV